MEFENLSPHYTEGQFLAGAALSAGELITDSEANGFSIVDVDSGSTYSKIIKSPKVRAVKLAGVTIAAGEAVYFVAATSNVTNVASTNVLVGTAIEAAASADLDIVIEFDGTASFLKA